MANRILKPGKSRAYLVAMLLLLAVVLGGCKASVAISGIAITPEKPIAGEPFTVEAQAENKGLFKGDTNVVLTIDGEEAGVQPLSLIPKTPQPAAFTATLAEAGLHKLVINGVEQEFTVLKPASFQVTKLWVDSEQVVAGEMFYIKATVANSGEVAGTYTGDILLDGTAANTCKATIEPGSVMGFELLVKIAAKGDHTLSLEGQSCKIKAIAPAAYETELTIEPASLMVGGTFKVHAVVRNTGDIKGDFQDWLRFDGEDQKMLEAAIEPGGEAVFDAELKAPDRGDHVVSVGETQAAVQVKAPAHIAVTGIDLTDEEVKAGEAVTATVLLKNTGDVAGKFLVQLLINGKAAACKEVTVEPGSQEVEFPVTQKKGGVYKIACGEEMETLTVRQITRPATGTLLVKAANGGYCSVTISNGNEDRDAIFVFCSTSNPSKPLLTVFVRAGEKTKKIKIKNGTYNIYYSVGTDYDAGSRQFLTDADHRVFDQTMPCSGSRRQWTDYTLKIYADSGNASTSPVGDDEFPR